MTRLTIWSGLAAIALLASCSGGPTATMPSANAPATGAASQETKAASNELEKPFGATLTWPSGAQLTVSKPTVAKPDQYGMPQPTATQELVVVDVTFVNGTAKPVNPALVLMQARSGEVDAKPYFDSTIVPSTSDVLPGKTGKWKAGFVREKGAPFTMEVSVGFDSKGYYK